MLFRTHLAAGFLVSIYLIRILNIENQISFVAVLLFFSVFPDIDENTSKVWKKLRPASYFASLLGHRNLMHTIYFPVAISLTFTALNLRILGLAALVGYLLHISLDMLSKKGIAPFYPLSQKKIRGFMKVGSFAETAIFFSMILMILYSLL